MEGYKFEWEDEYGNNIPYWVDGTSVFYTTEPTDGGTRDITVTQALDDLYDEVTGINTTLANVTTSIGRIETTLASLPSSEGTLDIDIDPETGNWIINGASTEYPSRGEKPVIEVGDDGYWYVDGVKQTACPAQGPQGIPGEPGTTVYITGEGGGGGIAGRGAFNAAYNYAMLEEDNEQPNRLLLFGWILDDVDENNTAICKVIYHLGNGVFIDALGARVIGSAEGITGS